MCWDQFLLVWFPDHVLMSHVARYRIVPQSTSRIRMIRWNLWIPKSFRTWDRKQKPSHGKMTQFTRKPLFCPSSSLHKMRLYIDKTTLLQNASMVSQTPLWPRCHPPTTSNSPDVITSATCMNPKLAIRETLPPSPSINVVETDECENSTSIENVFILCCASFDESDCVSA